MPGSTPHSDGGSLAGPAPVPPAPRVVGGGGFAPREPGIEARRIPPAPTAAEHVLRGRRSHIFLLASGRGTLAGARGAPIAARAPCLIWSPRGAPASLRLEAGARGASASVPDAALARAIPAGPIGERIRGSLAFPIVGRAASPAAMRRSAALLETMEQELGEGGPAAESVAQHSLSLLLIELWRLTRPAGAAARPMPRNIVHTFLLLSDLHLTEHWPVSRYAAQVGVSKDRLNSAVRRATGRSPLDHLHERLAAEARTLLTSSCLQVAEIGRRLGFRDAAYFNRFFRRRAGVPPGRWRMQAARGRPAAETPSAAWP